VFEKWYAGEAGPLRLIGFCASGFSGGPAGQRTLFKDFEDPKQKRLDEAIDRIRTRYGDESVGRGPSPK